MSGATWVSDPVLGGALEFDASDVVTAAVPQLPGSGFTVAFWALRNSTHSAGNDGLFVAPDGNTGNKNVAGWVAGNDRIWGRVRSTGDGNLPQNELARMPGDDRWVYVVYRGDGSRYELLLDGANTTNGVSYNPASFQTTNSLMIGRQGSESWRGRIDDFRVYSRALSALDISQLIQQVNPQPTLRVDFGNATNNGGGDETGAIPGFIAFEDAEATANPARVRTYATALGNGGTADVTVRGYTHFRDYAPLTGGAAVDQNPLAADMVLRNADGVMHLVLDDLQTGTYEITTYHHSTQFGGGTLDIRLSDGAGLSQTIATGVPVSAGTTPGSISSQTFQFVALGSSVDIAFSGGADREHLSLNGFEVNLVTPGPAIVKTEVLALDINDRGAPESSDPAVTQPGFSEFLLGGTENSDFGGVTTHSYGGIDVSLTHSNGGNIGDRRRAEPTDAGVFTEQELLRDFVFARGTDPDDGIDVLIEGLKRNYLYEVTLWAFDDGSGGARISDWFANGELAVDDYVFDGGAVPPSPLSDGLYSFSFLASSDGSGSLLIGGRAVSGTDPRVFLNGLRLTDVYVVPEPSTCVLIAMGLAACRWRRRRKA